jgi:hypothetical protein
LQVVQQAANCQPTGLSPAADQAAAARYSSAAYLRLVLTMVVLHSYRCAKMAAFTPSIRLEAQLLMQAVRCTSISSSPAASDASAAIQAAAELPNLWDRLHGLWQQLGMGNPGASPAAMPLRRCAEAVQREIDTELQQTPAVVPPMDSNSSSSIELPAEGRLRREALCLMLQELAATLRASGGQRQGTIGLPRTPQQQWQQALDRQHQQLLEAVCLALPQVLLRTALLCGGGEPMLASAAAQAAKQAVSSWRSAESQQQEAQQMMPALLDSWLLLTGYLVGGVVQQQHQPQPSGLLFQAAATGRAEQHDSTTAQELRRAGKCKCLHGEGEFASSSSSSSFSCVQLDCASLMAVDDLLELLRVTKVGTRGIYLGGLPVSRRDEMY